MRPPDFLSHIRSTRRELGIALLLAALTLAVYAQVWRFEFVHCWDDNLSVSENPAVQDGLTWNGIRWAFRTLHSSNWVPLTWLSLMLDAACYNDWAGGFHLTNVVLHVANVLLVFGLFASATGNTVRSAFVAALFAVHPLHVESVAWVSERKDVLSMFFGLLSMCVYVQYARRGRLGLLAASLILFVFSLAAKSTFVTLPFVLLLIDFWPLGRMTRVEDSLKLAARRIGLLALEKLPFLAVSIGFCIVTVIAQANSDSMRTFAEFSLATRIANAAVAYAMYLKMAVLPVGLAAFYPHPGAGLDAREVAMAATLLLVITCCALAVKKKWPFVLVGWLWYLGTLVPMIGLVQVGFQRLADRYTYLPLLGVYLAIAWLLPALVAGQIARNRALPAFSAGAVCLLATLAYQQVGHWRNGVTLWTHTLEVTEHNAFATRLLGDALFVEGRYEEAITQHQQAIQIEPRNARYPARLGFVYRSLGRLDEAVEQFQATLALDNSKAMSHVSLGGTFIAMRRYAEARQALNRALELDESNPWISVQLGSLYRMIRDYRRSSDYCLRALELDDELLICHRMIAMNLRDQGRVNDAVKWLETVQAASPVDRDTHTLIAELKQLAKVHASRGYAAE